MNGQSIPKLLAGTLEKHEIRPYWLSRLIGCSPSTIHRIQNGTTPKYETILAIEQIHALSRREVLKRIAELKRSDKAKGEVA